MEILFRHNFNSLIKQYSKNLMDGFGIGFPQSKKKLLRKIYLCERLTRIGKYNQFSPEEKRHLSIIVINIWFSLFLVLSDDDYDSGIVDVPTYLERLSFLYAIIEFNFYRSETGSLDIIFSLESSCCDVDDLVFYNQFYIKSRQYLALLKSLTKPSNNELLNLLKGSLRTNEEKLNLFGSIHFASQLALIVRTWSEYGLDKQLIQSYVTNCTQQLVLAALGQFKSSLLKGGGEISFEQYIHISRLKSGSIVRICTELRTIRQLDEIREFYRKYDPSIFQFVLDDLLDYPEDSDLGIMGFLHVMIIEQGLLASLCSQIDLTDKNAKVAINEVTKNILFDGQWSSIKLPSDPDRPLVYVSIDTCHEMLINRQTDRMLRVEKLLAKRIELAANLRDAIKKKSSLTCQKIALRSGVLVKFPKLFKKDQSKIISSMKCMGLAHKARLLPYVVWAISVFMSLVLLVKVIGSWR